MVLSSYHWLHEQDGTISAPLQPKSMDRRSGTRDRGHRHQSEQDAAMSEQISNEDQQVPAMTRRATLAAAAVAPLSIGSAAAAAQLVDLAAEKNAAFMRGNIQRWMLPRMNAAFFSAARSTSCAAAAAEPMESGATAAAAS